MEGASAESTFRQLIFANGAMTVCANERAEFKLCRATPAGALATPEICEAKANSLLSCYDNIVRAHEDTKQFKAALDCLKNNKTEADVTSCAGTIEDFKNLLIRDPHKL